MFCTLNANIIINEPQLGFCVNIEVYTCTESSEHTDFLSSYLQISFLNFYVLNLSLEDTLVLNLATNTSLLNEEHHF